MSPPGASRLVVVGVILGAHGVRGDVRVKSFTAEPEACFDYGPLLDAGGAALLEALRVRPGKAHFIVTPKVPREKEAWDALKGARLHVPRAALPEASEDEFYIDDLVGLEVVAGGEVPIGRVKAVQNFGAGDLLEVAPSGGGRSVLVPFTRDDVPTVDIAAGRVVVATYEVWADRSGVDDGSGPGPAG